MGKSIPETGQHQGDAELTESTRNPSATFRHFKRTEETIGAGFHELGYAATFKQDPTSIPTDAEALHKALREDFAFAWGGHPAACVSAPETCPDVDELSTYAAWFAFEFAVLGASIAETVKMTLDLHDALDREYHLVEEPADLARRHFAAVHPDRIAVDRICRV
ncbi:hypothetical protein [Microbacterium capsulatum]|uniref:Uncharacterized protein n=1 Tax=Microbacterium capsulatum TaxID=3041921 RepID=A0ABU0XG57_9MICO|nr:hypothetical protein [Microbacterium sp. ASV81]MDQ4214041.1 hypothetical protein [Microbacterium sp. ASV81]